MLEHVCAWASNEGAGFSSKIFMYLYISVYLLKFDMEVEHFSIYCGRERRQFCSCVCHVCSHL